MVWSGGRGWAAGAIIALASWVALPQVALAQEERVERAGADNSDRHVTVSAEGKVSARPDMARISSGVVSEAATAKEALSANSAAMEKLLAGLKAAGIADKDIKTTSFDVSPRYQHSRDGTAPRIDGYRVSNDVSVVVRDLARLGPLLDQLVTLGANRISGLSFEIEKEEALLDDARRKAIANARQRAELYAVAAGVRLGKVLVISEQAVHVAPRGPMMARAMAAESVPIAEGSQEISARVTVTYTLE
jgi:uncharacterized protein YggE